MLLFGLEKVLSFVFFFASSNKVAIFALVSSLEHTFLIAQFCGILFRIKEKEE